MTDLWTPSHMALARRCFEAGITGSETARQLGDGFTRNSVIGWWNRHDLHRGAPIAREHSRKRRRRSKNAPPAFLLKAKPKPLVIKPEPDILASRPIAFMDLPELGKEANRCRWPIRGAGYKLTCCGADLAQPALIEPFCAFHRKRASAPARMNWR